MLNNFSRKYRTVLLGLFLLAALTMGGTANAATFDLCVGEATLTMPDGHSLPVWGLGNDPTGVGACTATVPGPALRVPWDDSILTINLRNTLTEPVSLNILGQQLTNNGGPVWDGGVTGARPDATARVRSFTHEAAENGGTATYTWGNLSAGTFMVQSGTNPAKQVGMGISAPVIKDAALNTAYAGVPYDQELILVFQEFDSDINAAVDAGTYGPGGTITSSVYREPNYFLINGMAYPDAGLNPVNMATPVNVGDRLLIRFINAGAETHMPMLLGDYFDMVAEDGNPLNYPRELYNVELNAAKTIDVVYEPGAPGRLPILDSRLSLNNAGSAPGGMLAYLDVGGAAPGGDTVTFDVVIYDAVGQTLTVAASSSDEPNVTLMANGFGELGWKSWLNFYRTTFTGVATRPAQVFVTSSGGGSATYTFPALDTVTFDSVTYDAVGQTLTVAASSTSEPGVSLTAEGYGALGWKSWLNFYRTTFTGVAVRPASVTVNSSGGGTATYTFPAADTVAVQNVIYDAGTQALTIIATSSDQPAVALTADGYGALGWKSWLNFYRTTFTGVATPPASVTVNSSGGGSATWTAP